MVVAYHNNLRYLGVGCLASTLLLCLNVTCRSGFMIIICVMKMLPEPESFSLYTGKGTIKNDTRIMRWDLHLLQHYSDYYRLDVPVIIQVRLRQQCYPPNWLVFEPMASRSCTVHYHVPRTTLLSKGPQHFMSLGPLYWARDVYISSLEPQY